MVALLLAERRITVVLSSRLPPIGWAETLVRAAGRVVRLKVGGVVSRKKVSVPLLGLSAASWAEAVTVTLPL